MVLCAFRMGGCARLDARGERPTSAYVYDGGRCSSPTAGGALVQGALHAGDHRVDDTEARRDANRMLLAGWLDVPPGRRAVRDLQRRLDDDGAAAVRSLRGDFVVAHASADGSKLCLYRGVTSMMPLFWRVDGDTLRWSIDPVDVLDGEPALADVATDLLPMVIAERGFPADRSWFSGVNRLAAGTSLTLRRGARPAVERFDGLAAAPESPPTLGSAADGLRERLHAACARTQSPGDAAVLLLSGGTDSAAVAHELGRAGARATGVHFTLDAFPGFAEDRDAAIQVADACGLAFRPYDMGPHVVGGGDYAGEDHGASLPQTHTPLQGIAASAREASRRGARFVFSGILADQIMAHDWQRGMLDVAGWSTLNPLVTGEPPWQAVKRVVATSFAGSSSPGVRDYLRHLRGLAAGDPAMALPARDAIVHPVGFTDEAARRVTDAVRAAAERARDQLASTGRAHGVRPGTTALFQVNESLNTPNLQAGILNLFLPRRRFFTTPYADRDVIEYALSLPNAFRIGLGHGALVDKFALRVAYARSGIPGAIGLRMQQARIDAFPAVYVNQNFARCRELLGVDSRLRAAGVLSDAFVGSLSRRTAHRYGEEIVRLCVVEQWLRRLVG